MMYKGQHSLTFESIDESKGNVAGIQRYNTWDDFHLIPTSRPVFNLPEVKSEYIDIPQRDGSIDLTTRLGYANLPRYGMRKGTWEFWVPSFLSQWPMDFQKLANAVHGLTKKIYTDDDPYYYYQGRITVDDWQNGTDGNGNKVTLGYTLEPFKTAIYKLGDTNQTWDPFCFSTDFFYSDGRSLDNTTGPTEWISIGNSKWVDFLFPSDVVHTEPHSSGAYDTEEDYPYLTYPGSILFSGAVQTSFRVQLRYSDRPSTSTRVNIQFLNEDVSPTAKSYMFYPFKDGTASGVTRWYATLTHDDFVVSHRDLFNRIRISVYSTRACDVSLILFVRSL